MKRFLVLFVLMLTIMLMVSINGIYAETSKSAEPPSSLSGKVVETMNGGGYTYVNIEKDGKKTWVAIPETKVAVGQNISFQPGSTISNFRSKKLNRTFEAIVFSEGTTGQHGDGSVNKSGGRGPAEVPANTAIKVNKASSLNAYTIAELYEKRTELDRKDVVVRGRVVKVSPEIMGKNWIHIQDGSGEPAKGTNDILVTSQELPSVGDTVTAEGVLYKDKDFGSGYKYSVILEQAGIKK
ncbi:MAG: DNA-binding protein [Nitrospiraceae bacterium]|nr:MAG: DNA-binding protein [Nitrospiraceae bacterium]